jgi:hypothetical protein
MEPQYNCNTKERRMNPCFVYDRQKVSTGSTKLRGFDIANALGWMIIPFNKEINNKKLIVLKQTDYRKVADLTDTNEVVIDMVDFEFPLTKFDKTLFVNFDYGIFACKKQLEIYKEGFKYPEKCRFIYHHWDKKLDNLKVTNFEKIKIGYFGASAKCHLFKQFKDIDYFTMPLSTEKHFDRIINEYVNYNVHYIIKPEKLEKQYGSLLKLSTAAALGCPVIALREGNNELLGDDYPFYCKSFDKEDIQETINFINHHFISNKWQVYYEGKKWKTALQLLKVVKDRTSIKEISRQYLKMII